MLLEISHLRRCPSRYLLEFAGEIVGVVESAGEGDLGNGKVGGGEKLGCFTDANTALIVLEGLSGKLLKNITEVIFA